MINWGINALNHGSSLAVLTSKLEYFQIDKEQTLNADTIDHAFSLGKPDRIFWYEQPLIKKARQLYAKQYKTAFDMSSMPSRYLQQIGCGDIPVTYVPHHASHAAAGYYTSSFNEAAVVVLDAIGEFDCASIWHGKDNNLKKVWSASYPNSLGLFYSAFTKLIGLTPLRDEFLLQQMSELGDPTIYYDTVKTYFNGNVKLTRNLHRGVYDWPYPIPLDIPSQCHIAAAVQKVFEEQLYGVLEVAYQLTRSYNLVYMGGCAMNSAANQRQLHNWNNVWSLPNPGDPSSAIGAVLWKTKQRIVWDGGPPKHI